MIRHCVFARFRGDVPESERAAIHADLEALRKVIDGMDTVHFSANVSPEPFARGFSHGFFDGVNHQELVMGRFPKSRGVRVGTVVAKTAAGVTVELAEDGVALVKIAQDQ